jgi:hypothetical protein
VRSPSRPPPMMPRSVADVDRSLIESAARWDCPPRTLHGKTPATCR